MNAYVRAEEQNRNQEVQFLCVDKFTDFLLHKFNKNIRMFYFYCTTLYILMILMREFKDNGSKPKAKFVNVYIFYVANVIASRI